ncbi:MAG TPA: amino acid ABC transporter substrate-binding protein [Gammaproteobacteria bacterium]|nr:amino acid ABC transporter substrate-binding protein [Gammaproteobacteria bacterium]
MQLTKLLLVYGILAVCCCNAHAASSSTLARVQARGYLKCGVSEGLAGFSVIDDDGTWSGFDVDICRALGAAIFHDDKHVRYIPLAANDRFTALQSGEIDILSRNTTWTLTRDVDLGMVFTTIVFYDGQGFLVHKKLGITKLAQLNNVTICCNSGTTTELNTADYFQEHDLKYQMITFAKDAQVVAAYDSGRCDVYTADHSALAAQRLRMKNPADHVLLDETISKEPLAPAVRQEDAMWLDVVRWIVFGLMNAEEEGITRANLNEQLKSNNANVKRLLGTAEDLGHYLGLSSDFLLQAIKVTGNYGEIYERNVGINSQLKLPRGLNNLWNKQGLIYGAPYR